VAESLFGAVLHQLRVPGAPLLTGMGPVKLDMNTFQALYNSAEYYTTILGICEMAKWMDIPNWGYAGTSDSQCVDANAGIDITELTLLSMQAGSNLNHDIGYLDFGLTGAGELVVMTDEVISMNRRALEGIEVTDETLGLDVIAAAGHGGDFLRARHTKKYVRGQQWRPTLLNRDTQKNWEAAGKPTATDKAHAKLVDIMTNHTPEPLTAEQKKVVDELVDAYVAAGK
jgi:trimethylamine--corrinoid protein Co-methyltransferase